MSHAVEVAFERVDVGGPETAERSEPRVDFLERFRIQPVKAALRVHRGVDESCLAQHAQVLGNSRLGQTQSALDFADGLLGACQQAEDSATAGFSQNRESGFHGLYIPEREYARQGIYRIR